VATAMRKVLRSIAFMLFLTVWAIVVTTFQSREMLLVGKQWATGRYSVLTRLRMASSAM
jgi:hypothetical protein